MALARCIRVMAVLCATARQASGFGLGIGRVAPRNVGVAGDAGYAAEVAARRSGYYCGRTGGTSGGFTAAVAVGEGIWGTAAGQGGGRTRRGVRNGGALMMNSGKKARKKEQQFAEGMSPSDGGDYPVCAMEDDPTLPEVLTAVKAADERKAGNIVAIRVATLTVMTEFMVVLEGNSRPQNQAIAQNIEEKMEEMHQRKTKSQGAPESGWILLDYGDIIVHIMTPKSRSYYDLESFWSNGERVPLDGVLKPNVPEPEVAVVEEVDPFWS
ncbi:unnamed protein product [Ectocarpus sp. 13 AM-2016]